MPSGELPVVGIVEIEDTMIRSAILVLVICGALAGVLGGKFWTKRIIYLFINIILMVVSLLEHNTLNSGSFASFVRENEILAKWRNHSVIF